MSFTEEKKKIKKCGDIIELSNIKKKNTMIFIINIKNNKKKKNKQNQNDNKSNGKKKYYKEEKEEKREKKENKEKEEENFPLLRNILQYTDIYKENEMNINNNEEIIEKKDIEKDKKRILK